VFRYRPEGKIEGLPPSHEQNVIGSVKQEREISSGYRLRHHACKNEPLVKVRMSKSRREQDPLGMAEYSDALRGFFARRVVVLGQFDPTQLTHQTQEPVRKVISAYGVKEIRMEDVLADVGLQRD
jgi:hypothetical protein